MRKAKGYIYTELNPSKRDLYDPVRDDFVEVSSIEDILISLQISASWYKAAWSLSDSNDSQVLLKRPQNSRFVNNCFLGWMHALEANLDIQPVFNHYQTVTYMCTYVLKSEDNCMQRMSQAKKGVFEKN